MDTGRPSDIVNCTTWSHLKGNQTCRDLQLGTMFKLEDAPPLMAFQLGKTPARKGAALGYHKH